MIELHRYHIFERIQVPGRQRTDALRNQLPPHQRKGIKNHARVEPRDETAARYRKQYQAQQRDRRLAPAANLRFSEASILRGKREIENGPQDKPVNQDRAQQMRGQPILADVRIANQPALDHVPAEQALESAQ